MIVVQALDMGEPGQPATLGEVAARLKVDPAQASRTVADAVHAGYIRRIVGSDGDSRLALTDAGCERLQAIRHQHRVGLLYLTHDWAEEERALFARLITRFVDAADQPPGC